MANQAHRVYRVGKDVITTTAIVNALVTFRYLGLDGGPDV
jgi:hypothetical protein